MKRIFFLLASLCGVFFFIHTAQASSLLGRFPQESFLKLLSRTTMDVSLFETSGTFPPTDLGRTVTVSSLSGHMIRQSGSLYYTDPGGFGSMDLATGLPILIKPGTALGIQGVQKPWILLSDDPSVDTGHASFLYNLTTKKQVALSPTVGTISTAAISDDGKTVALVAKNSNGNLRLFLGSTKSGKLHSYALPKNTEGNCTTLSLSPKGTLMHLGCRFQLPGETPKYGMTLIPLRQGVPQANQPWIANVQLIESRWLSETSLVSHEWDLNKSTRETVYRISIKNGAIAKKQSLFSNRTTTISGQTMTIVPSLLAMQSPTKIWIVGFYAGEDILTSNDALFGTIFYEYDLKAKKLKELYHDASIWYLPEEITSNT